MSYNPVGIGNGFSLDTTMHKLSNIINSQSRQGVQNVLQNITDANNALAEKGEIIEPEATRGDITQNIYDRLTKIEEIIGKSNLNVYFKQAYVARTTILQGLKTELKELTQGKTNEQTVNDMIDGGR